MAISFEKQASGKVTLTKGEGRVLLRKGAEPLRATASWPPDTDYDVYALLVLRDGSTRAVAMFGAEGQPAQASFGGVRHLGDVGRFLQRVGRDLLQRLAAVFADRDHVQFRPGLGQFALERGGEQFLVFGHDAFRHGRSLPWPAA